MSVAAPRRRGLLAALASVSDGAIIRTAFYLMLIGTLAVLFIDWRELTASDATALLPDVHDVPVLPAFDPDSPNPPPGPAVTSDPDKLKAPLTASLGQGGVLLLEGTVDPGASDRVALEVSARGEYIKRVRLDSPGGSVDQAIKIGQLIQEHGFATEVDGGNICASSCPLIFAGGHERIASPAAAIGVHQIYTSVPAGTRPPTGLSAADAISEAQKTTAKITRYLESVGVDPAVWLNALDTPPDKLYYLSPDELTKYKLATTVTP